MRTKILQLLFLCILSIYATHIQAQNLTWAKSTAGTSFGGVGTGIATDATGNVYTTGWFSGTTDFDFGLGVFNMTAGFLGTDAFISKTDVAGNFVWAKQLTGLGSSNGTAITVDAAGDIYAMGYFTGTSGGMSSGGQQDVYIRKLSPSGSTIWTRQISGGGYVGYAMGTSIVVDATGNVYATGTFDASFGFGGVTLTATTLNVDNTFICKLNPSGSLAWAKKIGNAVETPASGIAVDASGNVYTVGSFSGTVDFDPNAGVYNLTIPLYATNTFINKLDASGNFVWTKTAGWSDSNTSIAINGGNIYIGGEFTTKLDLSGNVIWNLDEYSHAIKTDALGNIYTVGTFYGGRDFDPSATSAYQIFTNNSNTENVFIRKLDASGNFVWAKSMRPKTNGTGRNVAFAVDNANNVLVTGDFTDTSDFDPNAGIFNITASTSNHGDIFIAKFSQCPIRVMPVSVANGTLTIPYSQQLTQTGLTGTPIWTVTLGTLPAGLTLNASTGIIAGTPSAVGLFKFMVEVTGGSCPQTMEYSIDIVDNCPAGAISYNNLANQFIGVSYYRTLTQTGLTGTITWSISTGILPTGLSIGANTGVISGTPIVVGTFNFTVRATNGVCSKLYVASIIVTCPPIGFNDITVNNPLLNTSYSLSVAATGNVAALTYSITPTLPLGLSLNTTTGLISGTPTVITPSASYTVTASQNNGVCIASKTYTFSIVCASISSSSYAYTYQGFPQNEAGLSPSFVGASYSAAFSQVGLTGAINWSVSVGALPPGFTLSPTGVISGISNASGIFNFTIQVTSGTCSQTQQCSISVQPLNLSWVKRTSVSYLSTVVSTVLDASGNIYTVGQFTGTQDFDPGQNVFNLTSTNTTSGGTFITKLDANGIFVWAKEIGNAVSNVRAADIAVDISGNIYVTGGFNDTADFDPGVGVFNLVVSSFGTNMFIMKLNNLGNFAWAKSIGDDIYTISSGMDIDALGNIYITGIFQNTTVDFDPDGGVFLLSSADGNGGRFTLKLNTSGGFIWAKNMGGNALTIDSIGNVYVSGSKSRFNDPGLDIFNLELPTTHAIFVCKIGSSGNYIWAKVMPDTSGGLGGGSVSDIAIDNTGSVYITGASYGLLDLDPSPSVFVVGSSIFIAKLDNLGNFIWAKPLGSNNGFSKIVLDALNNSYISGTAQSTVRMSKRDPNGYLLWQKILGLSDSNEQYFADIALDNQNNIIVTGLAGSNANFAINPNSYLLRNGGMFTAKYSPISCPSITINSGSLPNGTINVAYNQALTQTGLTGTLMWGVSYSGLPVGLSLALNTGIISGVPTITGTYAFGVDVTNGSCTQYKEFTIVVSCPTLSFSTIPVVSPIHNTPYSLDASVSGGSATITYAVTPALPAGLSLNTTTGLISGTPTVITAFATYIVTASQGTCSLTKSYIIDVQPAIQIRSLDINLVWADKNIGDKIKTDAAGNIYIVGSGSISKYDASKNLIWTKPYDLRAGGLAYYELKSMTLDAMGNIYMTGSFQGTANFATSPNVYNMSSIGYFDMFVSKFDNLGNLIWAKQMGRATFAPGYALVSAIDVDALNDVYITGSFTGVMDFNPSNSGINTLIATNDSFGSSGDDVFICKLSANGNFNWVKQIGAGGHDSGFCIKTNTLGDVYISGYYTNTVDINPNAGIFNLTSSQGNSPDIFLCKLSTTGNFIWAKRAGGNIVLDAQNNLYMAYTYEGTADFDPGIGVFNLTSIGSARNTGIAKLDASGNFIWAKSLSGTTNGSRAMVRDITLDATGNIYTSGRFSGIVDFDPSALAYNISTPGGAFGASEIYFNKLDASGNFLWAEAIIADNLSLELMYSQQNIIVDIFDDIYLNGDFAGTTDFDPTIAVFNLITPMTNQTNSYIAKYTPCPVITINTASMPNGIIGTPYSQALNQTGLSGALVWIINSGILPTGLNIDASSGIISGTPTSGGTYNFTVQVTSGKCKKLKAYSIAIPCASGVINPTTLPDGIQGIAYSQTLTQIGISGTPIWSVSVGTLPNGLIINANTGVITGTPTTGGIYNFTIRVTNGLCTTTQGYTVSILACPITILPVAGLQTFVLGTNITPITFSASGGVAPYTYAITSGTLPAGLVLNAGIISGIPTIVTTGSFAITVTTSNGCQKIIVYPFVVTCNASITISPALMTQVFTEGTPITPITLSASGSTAPYTYAITTPLPAGLYLSNLGIISGTPEYPDTQNVTITATASNGCVGTIVYVFVINPRPPCSGAPTAGITTASDLSIFCSSDIILLELSGNTVGNDITYDWESSLNGITWTSLGSIDSFAEVTPLTTTQYRCVVTCTSSNLSSTSTPITITTSFPVAGVAVSSIAATCIGGTVDLSLVGATIRNDLSYYWEASLDGITWVSFGNADITTTTVLSSITYYRCGVMCSSGGTLYLSAPVIVNVSTITINQTTLPNATIGTPYAQTLTQTGLSGALDWYDSNGALPDGLYLDYTTGEITGTPTQSGTYTFTIEVGDNNSDCTASQTYTIVVACPTITISQATLPNATIGTPYAQTLTQTGLSGTLYWSESNGALPDGLSLDYLTGEITGTPTQNGTYTFTIEVSDNNSDCTASQTYTIVVSPVICPTIIINQTTLPNAIPYTPYTQTLTQTGLSGTLYWSEIGTTYLPDGLGLNSTTGEITGTPTQSGTYTFTIEVGDNNSSCTASQTYTIVVACPTITINQATLPNATIGTPYAQTLTQTGLSGTLDWYDSNGTLPDGLYLDYTTGEITGAPYQSGTYTFTIEVSDNNSSCTASQTYTIIASCPTVTVNPANLPNGTLGTSYSQTITQIGFVGAGDMWLVSSGDLPDGLGLGFSTGEITGIPTLLGTFTFTVEVAYGDCTQSKVFTIIIGTAPAVATQTITFNTLAPITYGAVPFALVGNASSSLPVSYTSANTSVATVSGNIITIVGAGTTTITATQIGNSSYSAATPMTQQLTVLKKDLTVTAPNISLMPDCGDGTVRGGGDPMPTTFVLTYTGFVYNETVVVLTTLPTTTTQYVAGRSARYLVIASGAQADNYNFVYVDGMITVEPCPFWRPTATAVTAPDATGDTSLEEWLSNQIKVYPNPSKADFNVDFGTLNLGKSLVRVYDAQGKTVFSSETEINNNTMKIALGNVASGLYLLEINSTKGRVVKRLVKMD